MTYSLSAAPARVEAPTGPAIAVEGLRKSFGNLSVLDGIDFEVPPGSVFALLGPNGAGKTTAVRILTTLLRPDAGTVRIDGHDLAREPQQVRASIGVTGQYAAVDELFTGRENVLLMADLHHLGRRAGRRRADELLELFDLVGAADRPAGTYSGGMRRRLDIAMSLVARPPVLFLDEPTTGLDPRARRMMWEIVRQLTAEGVTVFLTTQYLEEADALANRIALLDEGHFVAEGTPEQLKRMVPGGHVTLRLSAPEALGVAAARLAATAVDERELTVQVPSDGSLRSLREMLATLESAHIDVADISIHTPDLDDVFLALTGRTANDKEHP